MFNLLFGVVDLYENRTIVLDSYFNISFVN